MGKGRKVSSISREFDGKEVQGKLIERSGLFGSKMSKEVFKMPSGGKHIEKTRTNKKGDVVSRMSRDTKVNPLKFFNDNKEKAIKKDGGEMDMFKKSLKKADNGIQMGPMTEQEAFKAAFSSAANDPMNYGQGPRLNPPTRNERIDALMKEGARSSMDAISKVPQYGYGQNNAAMATMAASGRHKKGGPVKRKRK